MRFEIRASGTQVANAIRSIVAFGGKDANEGVVCSWCRSGIGSVPEAFLCPRQCLLHFGLNCGSFSISSFSLFVEGKEISDLISLHTTF
jgi:hypothetical protein